MKHVGPGLDKGPMPAIFYFALSAQDSLYTDPFNQPVTALNNLPIRIYSIDLPAHENGKSPHEAMDLWAESDLLTPFFTQCQSEIDEIIKSGTITKAGTMGLSRGGWVALQMAIRNPTISSICAFAPITNTKWIKSPPLDLDILSEKTIRFYIGNHDSRVSTRSAFDLIETLADTAFEKKIRSAPIEMMITPSIGHHGHGTAPHIFTDGAKWLYEKLC